MPGVSQPKTTRNTLVVAQAGFIIRCSEEGRAPRGTRGLHSKRVLGPITGCGLWLGGFGEGVRKQGLAPGWVVSERGQFYDGYFSNWCPQGELTSTERAVKKSRSSGHAYQLGERTLVGICVEHTGALSA